tara:strand:- start:21 stop:953 length:933 start_codon:yes stop_codon:yes gene_type:complete
MPSTLKLDVKDKKLLAALEIDSRASISQIAKKIGISKEVANYRLKRLIKSGFIRRFKILIDRLSLDLKHYRLIIDLHNLKENIRQEMISNLRSTKNLDLSVFLQGSRDIEIEIFVKKPHDFYTFYNKFMEQYARYIKRKNLSIVTKQYIFGHRYLHGSNSKVVLGDLNKTVKLSDIDLKILDYLEKDPRAQILEIAKELKLAPSTILHHFKTLKKKDIIEGYSLILNKSLLGYSTYRVEITLNDLSKKDKLISYLSAKENITKITEFVGEMDLDFEADFKTARDLDTFLEKLRVDLNFIRDFEVISVVND